MRICIAQLEPAKAISKSFQKTASTYQMTTFMGISGGHKCAGKSSVRDSKGKLIAQLNCETEGVILYDTETGAIVTFILLNSRQ